MKKVLKRTFCVFMALTLILAAFTVSSAAENEAKMNNIYGNKMLFQQNKEAVFEGKAKPGSMIEAKIANDGGTVVSSGKAQASRGGTFSLSCPGVEGGYTEYTVTLTQDGEEFARLTEVVFGELWLSSGQSNMQYELGGTIEGLAMAEQGKLGSKWVRALLEPVLPKYNGEDKVPDRPQSDVEDVRWCRGDESDINNVSAVAFFFAEKLEKAIKMPVGILNVSVGGSLITTWLSRDAIDADAQVKKDMTDTDRYITSASWDESKINRYTDMSANYNLKVAPLAPFKPAGMIWYQGEGDLAFNWPEECYSHAFRLMQESYTDLFGLEDGLLPIVYSQIADYVYEDYVPKVSGFNRFLGTMALENPDVRGCVTIYDVPLDYTETYGSIHPGIKQPVGEKMADTAMNMIYDKKSVHTAATLLSSRMGNGSIIATLQNVGDGLRSEGETLEGFSICDKSGVYVQAKAEILTKDTIEISCEHIPNPVSAAYAYSVTNQDANLYSTVGDDIYLPVSPFVTDDTVSKQYWFNPRWADCNTEKAWRTDGNDSGYMNCWEAKKALIMYGKDFMSIIPSSDTFSVSPVLSTKKSFGRKTIIKDGLNNWSNFGVITMMVRNNGIDTLEVNGMRIDTERPYYYMSFAASSKIPADGEWYRVSFNLNNLYILSCKAAKAQSNDVLSNVYDVTISFTSSGKAEAEISAIEFLPENDKAPTGNSSKLVFPKHGSIASMIPGFFLVFFDRIVSLFVK